MHAMWKARSRGRPKSVRRKEVISLRTQTTTNDKFRGMSLSLCPGCSRHVRASVSSTCPFCGGAIAASVRAPAKRASRTVRILGVAALGVACGGTTSPSDGGTADATEDFSPQPAYGAVIPDSGLPDGFSKDATSGDAGDASDASDDADSSGIALYGAPPPPDGG